MNDVIKTIESRRTIHDYDSRPVPELVITSALESAIRAPNHKLTNPWRFIRVAASLREAIAEIAVEAKGEKRPVTAAQEVAIRKKVLSSPELIVVAQAIDADPFRRREDYAACACAIQNFCLALWSEGVGSKWSSGSVTWHPKTYDLIDVNPETYEIIAFVWVGYPAVVPDPPRHPLSDVLKTVS